MAYPLGTLVQLTGTFNDAAGRPADPTTVTLYLLAPGQVQAQQITGGALTRASTGIYTYNVYFDTPGTWMYCWQGTGAVEAATFDITVQVQPSVLRTT